MPLMWPIFEFLMLSGLRRTLNLEIVYLMEARRNLSPFFKQKHSVFDQERRIFNTQSAHKLIKLCGQLLDHIAMHQIAVHASINCNTHDESYHDSTITMYPRPHALSLVH